jgi:hypothetical protein
MVLSEKKYEMCSKLIPMNPLYEFSDITPGKQWRVHTCFESCQIRDKVDPSITLDTRPFCDELGYDYSKGEREIICVDPLLNDCEVFQHKSKICFDEEKMVCIGWLTILLAIIISNFVQIIFEATLAWSLEITFKPTYLDKIQQPEKFEEEQEANPDHKQEPSCKMVLSKCCNELLSIIIYLFMVALMAVGLVHHISYGKPLSCLVEFAIALGFDQIKHFPVQFFIWWTVVRRCGKFEPGEFEEWDDETIAMGGQEMSLFEYMRHSVRMFLENKYIS